MVSGKYSVYSFEIVIMGLGITIGDCMTEFSVPLRHMDDVEMRDNSWLVEHLRQLADKIEQTNPKIYKVGIEHNVQYGPALYVECFTSSVEGKK